MSKTVLITGGSRGIGKALVEYFAKKGYQVAFTYLNSEDSAENLVKDFGAKAYRVDFSSIEKVLTFGDVLLEEFGCPDVMINNAGVSHYGLFQDGTLDEFRRIFAVNFESAYFLTKELVPSMISRKEGCIINISSIWGECGASCEVLYSSSKAALIGFTKALAKELAPCGISVNCIAPGVVDTDMMAHFTADEKAFLAEEIPSGRFTTPEEVAKLAFNLAEFDSVSLTGQVIGINGGMLC